MALMAAVGAASGLLSAVTGFAQANYQSQVVDMNADIAKDNARRARERASIQQETNDRQTAALIGEQTALQGAGGLSISGRSAMLTRKSARMLGRLDALNIQQGGAIESYNYLTQSANFKAQAGADRMSGFSSLVGGFLQAGSSLIGQSKSTAYNPFAMATI